VFPSGTRLAEVISNEARRPPSHLFSTLLGSTKSSITVLSTDSDSPILLIPPAEGCKNLLDLPLLGWGLVALA